jgi:xanthine dehydrogenase accessory factor
MTTVFDTVREAIATGRPIALCTIVSGRGVGSKLVVAGDGKVAGGFEDIALESHVVRDARELVRHGATEERRYAPGEGIDRPEVVVFIQAFVPPPHLILFGAADFTRALSTIGRALGYRVTVCDARETFATPARFPDADEVAVEWPDVYLRATNVDERTVIAVLTHDPKFDVPALLAAVRTPAEYIGAMGSRRANADRARRLIDAGMNEADLSRIRSPIGLDIGPRTPEETAISMFAEVIALRSGRSGVPLTQLVAPIHPG